MDLMGIAWFGIGSVWVVGDDSTVSIGLEGRITFWMTWIQVASRVGEERKGTVWGDLVGAERL